MTEPEAQAALAGIALELVAIADRLQAIHDALPPSRNRDAMLEHRRPYDVATEVSGTIECVVADQLRPAIEHLEAASRVTAEELRERPRGAGAPEAVPRADLRGGLPMAPETIPEPEGAGGRALRLRRDRRGSRGATRGLGCV